MQPQGLHDGHHHKILSQNCGGFSHTISPPNPTEVPIVTYEYLLCLPSKGHFQPPTQRKARGLLSGSCTPGTTGSPVTTQNPGYDQFPLVANDWGTIHPIPDMAPPLQAKEEGPPT
jgi:hypothetical protein